MIYQLYHYLDNGLFNVKDLGKLYVSWCQQDKQIIYDEYYVQNVTPEYDNDVTICKMKKSHENSFVFERVFSYYNIGQIIKRVPKKNCKNIGLYQQLLTAVSNWH